MLWQSNIIRTPRLDQLAQEGQRWTQFYVAAPVCTPKPRGPTDRSLPDRNGMTSAKRAVLFPDSGVASPKKKSHWLKC